MEAIRAREGPGRRCPIPDWRQGDCALGQWYFLKVPGFCSIALTNKLRGTGDHEEGEREACEGIVVLTQSCDIVRAVEDYPFVEIAPLVRMDGERMAEVKARRRPQYALVPGVEARSLVADLGRILSVKKQVLEAMPRVVGCQDDLERRTFASAIGRKFSRFAFPDDFIEIVSPLRRRLTKRHGKDSPEGRAVTALYEVRVRAAPSWNASKVEVHFWFLWDERDNLGNGVEWEKWCDEWLGLISSSEKYIVTGLPAGLGDLTARDYVDSEALDLDHLSAESEE